MWYENLANADMNFICAHIFRNTPYTCVFDVCFVDFPPVNPKN
jgi:hypothetical protein